MKPKDKEKITKFLKEHVDSGTITEDEAHEIYNNIPSWTEKNKEYIHVNYTTPEGNKCSGFLCKKRTSFKSYGSLYLYAVNNHPVSHYYQCMPRLRYVDHNYFDKDTQMYYIYEKFDGTNIVIYPLKDHNNDIIEAVPKTRGMPVIDKKWVKLLNNTVYFDYFKDICFSTGDSIVLELFGSDNIHEIPYDIPTEVAYLFTIKPDGSYSRERYNGIVHNKNAIMTLLKDNDKFICKSNIYEFVNKYPFITYLHDEYYENPCCFIHEIQENLEEMNQRKNYMQYEGVVVYKIDDDFIISSMRKCKPKSVMEHHFERAHSTIPRNIIKNCIRKAYEVEVDSKQDFINEINNELLQDFSEEYVFSKKNQKKIYKILADLEAPADILEIAEKLYHENLTLNKTELMRVFAKEYPELKAKSRQMYQAIEAIERFG